MEKKYMVYLTAMRDALAQKCEVLEHLLDMTKKQECFFTNPEFAFQDASDENVEAFDELLAAKERLIQKILDLDRGFEGLYNKVESHLKDNKEEYRVQILEMQDFIRRGTDIGVKIQALEQKNKRNFESLLVKKRQEIQEFRLGSRTAGAYTRHMAGQQFAGEQSFYIDKKK